LIVVAVGTFIHGYDELVQAADHAAAALALDAFAQIGHSSVLPRHMQWERFLPRMALLERLHGCELLIAHAGVGLVRDAVEARCRLLLVPRRGPNTPGHPINDQRPFARKLACHLPVTVCEQPADLVDWVKVALSRPAPDVELPAFEAPRIIADYLMKT